MADELLKSDLYRQKDSLLDSFWSLLPHINEKYVMSCTADWILQTCSMIMELLQQPQPAAYEEDAQMAYDAVALLFVPKDHKVHTALLCYCYGLPTSVNFHSLANILIFLDSQGALETYSCDLRAVHYH